MPDLSKTHAAPRTARAAALLYHNVGEYGPGTYASLTVSPTTFAGHMAALKRRGYQGISAQQWQASRLGKAGLPRKPVILTFDDGYASLTRHAFPVLEEHGFRATVFVVTDRTGGEDQWLRVENRAPQKLLSKDEILGWKARGVDFGAHSRTHPDLTRLSPEALHDEVVGSALVLQEMLGERATAFAYPYGFYTESVLRAVGAEFVLGFTVEEGMNDLRTDPLRLRRTMVQPTDKGADVLWRAAIGWHPIESARRRTSKALRRFLRLSAAPPCP